MSALQVVSALIRNHEGEILIAQRPPGKTLAGLWEFPGGKIEIGESEIQALHRELKEELELDVRIEQKLGSFAHVYDWGAIELQMFTVLALNAPRPTADVHVFRWVNPASLDIDHLAPADVAPWLAFLNTLKT